MCATRMQNRLERTSRTYTYHGAPQRREELEEAGTSSERPVQLQLASKAHTDMRSVPLCHTHAGAPAPLPFRPKPCELRQSEKSGCCSSPHRKRPQKAPLSGLRRSREPWEGLRPKSPHFGPLLRQKVPHIRPKKRPCEGGHYLCHPGAHMGQIDHAEGR